jgi:hypothetical protein
LHTLQEIAAMNVNTYYSSTTATRSGTDSVFNKDHCSGKNCNKAQADQVTHNSRELAIVGAASNSTSGSVTLSLASIEAFKQSSVAETTAVAALPKESVSPAANPYAKSILTAINGQLALDVAEGASQEELQSRLEAGLSGFLTGFDDAFEQLSGLADFSASVRGEVLATKEQVLAGLAHTAEQLGLDASAITQAQEELRQQSEPAKQKSPGILQSASYSESSVQSSGVQYLSGANAAQFSNVNAFQAKENSFTFELATADGDKIKILVSSLDASRLQADRNGISAEAAQKNSFEFSVEGELDESELKAINDLLNQVNNLSESFFNGNVEQAFDQALNMGFDSGEIQSFSLKLTQTSYSQVEGTYGAQRGHHGDRHGNKVEPSKNLVHLGNFLQELEKANLLAEKMGQELSLIGQLADQFAAVHNTSDTSAAKFIDRLSSRQV